MHLSTQKRLDNPIYTKIGKTSSHYKTLIPSSLASGCSSSSPNILSDHSVQALFFMAANTNNTTDTPDHHSLESSRPVSIVADPASPVIDEVSTDESAIPSYVNGGENNGNVSKKPTVWNKPSNVTLAESVPVMGAESWPALGESTRISTKSPTDSSKGLPSPQGIGAVSSPLFRQASSTNANHSTDSNHTTPTRQRSTRHNGVGTSSNNGGTQLPAPLSPLVEVAQRNGSASQSHNANDHMQQRNSFRGRNNNPHTREESSRHHGGRRDQDRRNQDWSVYRNFNAGDAHMPPQRVGPRFWMDFPPAAPPVRPFANPMAFPASMFPPTRFPYVDRYLPAMSSYLPAVDLFLPSKIVAQIDYYFSNENLVRDSYLRKNMDDQGWVPIQLIAGFNKVKMLTEDIRFILDALRTSHNVEVQGDKVRRRNDWMRYPRIQFADVPISQSPRTLGHDVLATGVQGVALEEKSGSSNGTGVQTDISAELSDRSLSVGEGSSAGTSDQSALAKI